MACGIVGISALVTSMSGGGPSVPCTVSNDAHSTSSVRVRSCADQLSISVPPRLHSGAHGGEEATRLVHYLYTPDPRCA